jgi:hypothetical protein
MPLSPATGGGCLRPTASEHFNRKRSSVIFQNKRSLPIEDRAPLKRHCGYRRHGLHLSDDATECDETKLIKKEPEQATFELIAAQ